MVVDQDPVPPSRLVPRVERDLETICLKCLSKEPYKRYSSAAALAADLERYQSGETIEARRTPAWERGIKWSKRHPGRAALVLARGLAAFGFPLAGVSYYRYLLAQDRLINQRIARENQRVNSVVASTGEEIFHAQQDMSHDELHNARTTLSSLRSRI